MFTVLDCQSEAYIEQLNRTHGQCEVTVEQF